MYRAVYLRVIPPSADYSKEWYQLIIRDSQAVLSSGPKEQTKECFKRYYKEYGQDIDEFHRAVYSLANKVSAKTYEQGQEYMNTKGKEYDHILKEWVDECEGDKIKWYDSLFKPTKKRLRRRTTY